MEIRHTQVQDIPAIMDLYDRARAFMRSYGNMTQWINNYPSREIIEKDMENANSYVCVDDDVIVGTFAFIIGTDPTYLIIEDGAWLDDDPYGVVHRIASGKPGVGSFCLQWAHQQTGNIRIDTHRDNIPMQNLLKKLGYQYCGIIHIADGSERLAFQKH